LRKSVFRILLLICLISGLAAYAATPASAAPPFDTQNFLPDDTNVDPSGQVLSDKFDGTDALAHLTNVSTADTDFVTWYVCPSGTTAGQGAVDVTQAELASCTVIGTDSEGRRPAGGNEFAPTDEAYEFFWDIPGALDLRTRDIVAVACTGAPGTVVLAGANQNCVFDAEEDVVLEDAQTGNAPSQTSAAEMVSICTADVDPGPSAGAANPCEIGGAGAGTNAEVAARFRPFPHGSPVPNGGFVLRVTADAETDFLSVGIESPGDAQTDPNTPFFSQDFCAEIAATPTSRTFECVFTDAMVPDNAEFALVAFDTDNISGSGVCDTTDAGSPQNPPADIGNPESTGADVPRCKLDVHYAVSSARQAVQPSNLTFIRATPGGGQPADNTCTPADTEETNPVRAGGNPEDLRFCVVDQFGNPFNGQVTLVSAGPEGSGFTDCFDSTGLFGAGTLHDHNNDGRFEHCHGDTGPDGDIMVTIDNFTDTFQDATPGDQTITACVDPDPMGTNAAPGTGSGCADETVVATAVKHWTAVPEEIELVFDQEGVNDQTLCLTGDKFKENETGDTDQLLVCTFDGAGNFASTEPAGSGRLQWFIVPSGGGELTATRFSPNPPNETGGNGTNNATIEAFRPGNDIIEVCLQDDPGGNVGAGDCASVQKRVTEDTDPPPPPPDGPCGEIGAILGTSGNDILVGTAGDDIICGFDGDDIIRGLEGNDILLGQGGNDTVEGGDGNDTVKGGSGDDVLEGGKNKDVLRGGSGADTLKGNRGNDTLRAGSGRDTVRGGRGDDVNNGGTGRDTCRDRFGVNVFRNCER